MDERTDLLLFGARLIGMEYSSGTIRIAYARGIGRLRLLLAKLFTLAVVGVALFAGYLVVAARNADGQSTASSAPTAVVSSRSAPVNTARPTISGTAKVGEELSASNGTWSGGATSFTYQWQRCTSSSSCTDVDGATSRTYGVRSADVGDTLRVAVTAHNASGSTATAYADQTATVTSNSSTTTVVTTRNNRPPSVTFISLRRAGTLVYSRFRVCDDSTARVRVTERDTKPGALAYKRTFLVKAKPCLTYSRHWGLAARFRHGRYTATLQARDRQGATSAVRTRTLVFP